MIEVTLEHAGKLIDLLVPSEVTVNRLTQLIREGCVARGLALPKGFSLALNDKAFAVSGYDVISSFGIGNGDRLQIGTQE
ncbi:EsaB/YukD family protein [Rathayibacter rathayi]|uniref:Type VII secretion integral membrane protein EccD n=2 Tax=Rathayibacter rathayi TaxID=33887 RepID=A0ABD6W575_RATRA|nr:EsaB/YukD family protein [Rathayibacter rathayi]PPF10260.1 hypothetical protein C5C04_13585 [Rathayibacter rathayi]PPF75391.1 hypothetical protein C5C14_14100 [Rathayibacter rathayi]PPG10230.1 hypothetical protein C5C11_14360 [Rathayibacter rathayi]PPG36750.1 hypothetical protein C5C20_14980 [Rathayibacter rathayi]PPH30772.1 hypothetical protein C5C28_13850 [Rathayibacter rathayi]